MNKTLVFLILSFSVFSYLSGQYIENIAPSQGIVHSVDTELVFGGHGVSFFDFNKDGWDDISFVQEDDSLVFYINNNGFFESVASFAFTPGETRQVLWVDYDNDDDYDLFITSTNGLLNVFQNDGNFNFTDVTLQAGLSQFNANNYGVSFADFDNDGFLDFYIARYSMSGSENDESITNRLYKNNGDGTFTDVTSVAGVADSIQPSYMGAWIDINKDSYPDLYVINDRVLWGNSLYINNGDGTFSDFTNQSGLSMFGEDPMGVMIGDYNNNGNLDVLCSNGGPPTKPPRLYVNNGDSTFTENASNLGITVSDTFMCTWGGTWIDIDNDSYLDMYLTNGFLLQATGEVSNYFFRNIEGSHFVLDTSIFLGNHVAASYSVAKGDIDNDGYYDMVVQNAKDYNSFIWKNNYGPTTGNSYIKITLEGTVSNNMAIGSWIEVFTDGKTLTHYTQLGENFISQDSQHHIFGLENATEVDSVYIRYPSGHIDKYYNLIANEHYFFKEGETLKASVYVSDTIICNSDSMFAYSDEFQNISWFNGLTADSISIFSTGNYFYSAFSSHGIEVFSDTITITVAETPSLSAQVSNPSCFGANDGAIQVDVFHDTTLLNPQFIWNNNSTGSLLQNLDGGEYTVYYNDIAGCEDSLNVLLQNPPALINNFIITDETSGNDGIIEVMTFGGIPPYDYQLNNSAATPPFENLPNGIYSVTVSDINNCNITDTVFINSTLNTLNVTNEPNKISIYPNPVASGNKIIIKTTLNLIDNFKIKNIEGKVIVESSISSESIQINQNSGIYLIEFYDKNNLIIDVKKLIVN